MGDSLIWAEWCLLVAIILMGIVTIVSHHEKGVNHEFSQFAGIVMVALVSAYAVTVMCTRMVDNSVTLNPEKYAKFALPPLTSPYNLRYDRDANFAIEFGQTPENMTEVVFGRTSLKTVLGVMQEDDRKDLCTP